MTDIRYHCDFCKLRHNSHSYNIVLDHGYYGNSTNLDSLPRISEEEWNKIIKKLDNRINEYDSWKGEGCNEHGWFFGYDSNCYDCLTKDSRIDSNIEFIRRFISSYSKNI
jgi:hypothetical protein